MLSSDGGPAIFTFHNLKILKILKSLVCWSIAQVEYENKNNLVLWITILVRQKQDHKLDFYSFIFTESCDPNHDKHPGSDPTDKSGLVKSQTDRESCDISISMMSHHQLYIWLKLLKLWAWPLPILGQILKFHNAEMSHLLSPNLSSFSQINLQILKLIIISVEYNLNSVK